jgi:uncharacterized protein (DUF1499 family)
MRNWHDTDEPGADPGPLDLPLPSAEALARINAAIGSLPRWRVEATDAAAGTVAATRRTRIFRFTDDVTIRLEPLPTGARLHVRSKSRVGRSDFGQNRRNVLELFRALSSPVSSQAT